jgi:tripartite-type tricarboxylate transporter receptor subunit TctC
MRLRLIVSAVAALLLCPGPDARAAWPERPVRIIVPFVAGGSSDTLARILGEALREKLGQTVVVENRAGGGSTIGLQAVAGAPADGYTLLQGHMGTHAVTPAISPPKGYDVARTFTTVAVPATSASILVVNASRKIDSLQELIALARAKPDTLNYGSPGVGSPSHIATVQLAALTGIKVVHVPYRGNAAAITDMLGGTLDFMFASPAEILEHVRSGKLKALATTGEQRSPGTPQLPTIAESGVPGYAFRMWHVVSMHADTPTTVLEAARKAIGEILASPAFQKRIEELGLDRGVAGGLEAETFVQAEILKWGKVVKDTGLKVE